MKKNKYIAIAVVVVCLLATVVGAVKLCRYYLPQEGPTCALFERYKDNPYVKACLLRDFRVNDTLTTDALLLEAATDSAWCELLADFGMPKSLIDRYTFDKKSLVSDGRNSITKFYTDKDNIKKRKSRKKPESRLVIASHTKRCICVFLTDEQKTKETISLTEIKKLKNENEF